LAEEKIMYHLVLNIHIWTSVLFVVISLILSVGATRGYLLKKDNYGKPYIYLENSFILLLYLGLILGFILYFFMEPANRYTVESAADVSRILSLRFWSVEHFSVMLFALILAQIGKIFTSKSISHHAKFKYAMIYYGSATLATLISLGFYLANR
jgi:hypothetical protein